MKKISLLISIFFILLSNIFSQDCTILSKANDITPDRLCAPVNVVWEVTYTGVNDADTPVHIDFDWDDGDSERVVATETSDGVFTASATHTYISRAGVCNYHPRATLVVNGVICTSSSQEQIVTVWDDDDHNGGEMHINPEIWPICFGDAANVRFQDLTQFNCVPPQERDNPNVGTRWIQWIYGTDITMTGTPVTIGSRNRTFPFIDGVITLPGPVTGSGVWSDVINVANDKQIGEYFEVTLRNWNYCNPYDDPNIPGGPRDHENGDHPPVETTAIILIVPYPDATITPVPEMCENDSPVTLTAATSGGTWTGNGITGNIFDPTVSGAGTHLIEYNVTSANGCSDSDTALVVVKPVPDATIMPVGVLCDTDPLVTLVAVDTGGVWSGFGVIGNTFDPSIGPGNYTITYEVEWDGCYNIDQTIITVAVPNATIDPVDTLCVDSPPVQLTAHDIGGIWSGTGVIEDMFYPELAGVGDHLISYDLNNPGCNDRDSIIITVMPIPEVNIIPIGIIYLNESPVTLYATPEGGTWSGPGVSGDIFDPAVAGIGIHTIIYETLTDRFGCDNLDSILVEVMLPPAPIANWKPDTSGCTPLTVQFENLSEYAETYLWDFGTGEYSNEKNPEYTYYIPGEYLVTLTVTNISGSDIYSGVISVYQNPIVAFNAYPTNIINNDQIVRFYNYTQYGFTYLWDFGDGTSSIDEEPYHQYEEPGTYIVKLIVTSVDGCIDSLTLETPIIVDFKEGDIQFSNAFKWNGEGPTGGYWEEEANPDMDYVFRPHFRNIEDYKLQIFNRWGVLVYESNDLYKGWDGYWHDGKLAQQGVYVWRVEGRYANGEFFVKVGDVTFLH